MTTITYSYPVYTHNLLLLIKVLHFILNHFLENTENMEKTTSKAKSAVKKKTNYACQVCLETILQDSVIKAKKMTICDNCTMIKNAPEILASQNEENWRSLNDKKI